MGKSAYSSFSDRPSKLKSAAQTTTIPSEIPGTVAFIADTSGKLVLFLGGASRYLSPISNQTNIEVRVHNAGKRDTTLLGISSVLQEPIVTELETRCGGNFYLFGKGPYDFYNDLNPGSTADTYISDWDSDRNFGSRRTIEISRDHEIGLLKFDVPSLPSKVDVVTAQPQFFAHTNYNDPNGTYRVTRIAEPWGEEAVTWDTKPRLSNQSVDVPTRPEDLPSGYFWPQIADIVEVWSKGLAPNYGVAISVPEDGPDAELGLIGSDNSYLQPGFRMLFTNPSFTILENSFDSVSVSKGDTVFVSYHNEQPLANKVASVGSELKDILGADFYTFEGKEFERLYFFYHSNFLGDCRPYQQRAEIVELLSVIEPEQDSLQIAIEIPNPKEVWPTLRDRDGGNDSTRSNIENFVITVTDNDQPIADHEVQISAGIVPNSGGHDHTNVNDPALADRLGTFMNTETDESETDSLLTRTNQDGQVEIQYTAMEIGAELEIKVESTTRNAEIKDTLAVKVPDLVAFAGEGSYTLTGGDPALHTNENTHYLVSQAAIDSLISAADVFAIVPWNDAGEMRLNDMSLVWGGIFDFVERSPWQPPHSSHRLGTDVDIENISSQDTTVSVVNPETGQSRERTVLVFDADWINQYRRLMTGKRWRFIGEGQQDPFRNPEEENPGIRYRHFRWRGN